MAWTFWVSYLERLGIVTLVIAALYVLARRLRQTPLFVRAGRRLRLVETTMLSAQAALHVVRVGDRCFLIGSTAGSVTNLAEIRAGESNVEVAELADLVPQRLDEIDLVVGS
jgi:flagellar biosynthetic protein FliO